MLEKGGGHEPDFHWRGGDVSRIEGLSDAVFAFSLTLIVVSLEVPKTFENLIATMWGFIAFAACFALLILIWYSHYVFFRRYGLEDMRTIVYNSFLLFVVLFYIYPLKFLSTLLIYNFTDLWQGGLIGGIINGSDVNELMIIYAAGFVAVFSLLTLLYRHAYNKRDELELDEVEIFLTRTSIRKHEIYVAVALISLVLSILAEWFVYLVPIAGWIYAFYGFIFGIHGKRTAKRLALLKAEIASRASKE